MSAVAVAVIISRMIGLFPERHQASALLGRGFYRADVHTVDLFAGNIERQAAFGKNRFAPMSAKRTAVPMA